MILATGSRVKSLPGIEPDGKRIVTIDDVLRLDTLPESVIVVGAGAVGVEFASMYHDLGAKVTLLEYLPAIVPLEDRDVSKELERSFEPARDQGHHEQPVRRRERHERTTRRA